MFLFCFDCFILQGSQAIQAMVQVVVDAKGCHPPGGMGHLEIVGFR